MTVLLIAPAISAGTLKSLLWVGESSVKNITDEISREYKPLGLGPTKVEVYESNVKAIAVPGFGTTQVCIAFPLFIDDGAITYEDACQEAATLLNSFIRKALQHATEDNTGTHTELSLKIAAAEKISTTTQQYWLELIKLSFFYILKHQLKIMSVNTMRLGGERNVFLQICCEPFY